MKLSEAHLSKPFPILETGVIRDPEHGEVEVTHDDLDRAVAAFSGRSIDMPVDRDHGFLTAGVSRAAGWITRLFREGPQLLAEVAWTDKARSEIESGEYRFCSAELDPDSRDLGGLSLTNRPRLKRLGPVALSDSTRAVEARNRGPLPSRKTHTLGELPGGRTLAETVEELDELERDSHALHAYLTEYGAREGIDIVEATRRFQDFSGELRNLARLRGGPAQVRATVIAFERGETFAESYHRLRGGGDL